MSNSLKSSKYTFREELANGISHGIGAILALIGLIILLITATRDGDV